MVSSLFSRVCGVSGRGLRFFGSRSFWSWVLIVCHVHMLGLQSRSFANVLMEEVLRVHIQEDHDTALRRLIVQHQYKDQEVFEKAFDLPPVSDTKGMAAFDETLETHTAFRVRFGADGRLVFLGKDSKALEGGRSLRIETTVGIMIQEAYLSSLTVTAPSLDFCGHNVIDKVRFHGLPLPGVPEAARSLVPSVMSLYEESHLETKKIHVTEGCLYTPGDLKLLGKGKVTVEGGNWLSAGTVQGAEAHVAVSGIWRTQGQWRTSGIKAQVGSWIHEGQMTSDGLIESDLGTQLLRGSHLQGRGLKVRSQNHVDIMVGKDESKVLDSHFEAPHLVLMNEGSLTLKGSTKGGQVQLMGEGTLKNQASFETAGDLTLEGTFINDHRLFVGGACHLGKKGRLVNQGGAQRIEDHDPKGREGVFVEGVIKAENGSTLHNHGTFHGAKKIQGTLNLLENTGLFIGDTYELLACSFENTGYLQGGGSLRMARATNSGVMVGTEKNALSLYFLTELLNTGKILFQDLGWNTGQLINRGVMKALGTQERPSQLKIQSLIQEGDKAVFEGGGIQLGKAMTALTNGKGALFKVDHLMGDKEGKVVLTNHGSMGLGRLSGQIQGLENKGHLETTTNDLRALDDMVNQGTWSMGTKEGERQSHLAFARFINEGTLVGGAQTSVTLEGLRKSPKDPSGFTNKGKAFFHTLMTKTLDTFENQGTLEGEEITCDTTGRWVNTGRFHGDKMKITADSITNGKDAQWTYGKKGTWTVLATDHLNNEGTMSAVDGSDYLLLLKKFNGLRGSISNKGKMLLGGWIVSEMLEKGDFSLLNHGHLQLSGSGDLKGVRGLDNRGTFLAEKGLAFDEKRLKTLTNTGIMDMKGKQIDWTMDILENHGALNFEETTHVRVREKVLNTGDKAHLYFEKPSFLHTPSFEQAGILEAKETLLIRDLDHLVNRGKVMAKGLGGEIMTKLTNHGEMGVELGGFKALTHIINEKEGKAEFKRIFVKGDPLTVINRGALALSHALSLTAPSVQELSRGESLRKKLMNAFKEKNWVRFDKIENHGSLFLENMNAQIMDFQNHDEFTMKNGWFDRDRVMNWGKTFYEGYAKDYYGHFENHGILSSAGGLNLTVGQGMTVLGTVQAAGTLTVKAEGRDLAPILKQLKMQAEKVALEGGHYRGGVGDRLIFSSPIALAFQSFETLGLVQAPAISLTIQGSFVLGKGNETMGHLRATKGTLDVTADSIDARYGRVYGKDNVTLRARKGNILAGADKVIEKALEPEVLSSVSNPFSRHRHRHYGPNGSYVASGADLTVEAPQGDILVDCGELFSQGNMTLQANKQRGTINLKAGSIKIRGNGHFHGDTFKVDRRPMEERDANSVGAPTYTGVRYTVECSDPGRLLGLGNLYFHHRVVSITSSEVLAGGDIYQLGRKVNPQGVTGSGSFTLLPTFGVLSEYENGCRRWLGYPKRNVPTYEATLRAGGMVRLATKEGYVAGNLAAMDFTFDGETFTLEANGMGRNGEEAFSQKKYEPIVLNLLKAAERLYNNEGFLRFSPDGRLEPSESLPDCLEDLQYKDIMFYGTQAPTEEDWLKLDVKYMMHGIPLEFVMIQALSDHIGRVRLPGQAKASIFDFVFKNMTKLRKSYDKALITEEEAHKTLFAFLAFVTKKVGNILQLEPVLSIPADAISAFQAPGDMDVEQDVMVETTGDQHYRGGRIHAGRDIRLEAGGEITRENVTRVHHETQGDTDIWEERIAARQAIKADRDFQARAQGDYRETGVVTFAERDMTRGSLQGNTFLQAQTLHREEVTRHEKRGLFSCQTQEERRTSHQQVPDTDQASRNMSFHGHKTTRIIGVQEMAGGTMTFEGDRLETQAQINVDRVETTQGQSGPMGSTTQRQFQESLSTLATRLTAEKIHLKNREANIRGTQISAFDLINDTKDGVTFGPSIGVARSGQESDCQHIGGHQVEGKINHQEQAVDTKLYIGNFINNSAAHFINVDLPKEEQVTGSGPMTHEFYQLKSWSEEYGHSSGLTLGQTAALVGLTASLLTMGAGSTVVGSQAWLAGYMEALMVAGAGQVASTFVASHGDPIAAFRSLGSEAFLKSMAISLATMGVVGSAGAGATLGDKVLMSIKRAAFSSVLKIALTQENPRDILRGAFAQVAGEIGASAIGEVKADLGYFGHKLAHGIVGAISGQIAHNDPVAGAFGAVAAEVMAGFIESDLEARLDGIMAEAEKTGETLDPQAISDRYFEEADFGPRTIRIAVALGGAFLGLDVNTVDGAANNALTNNFMDSTKKVIGEIVAEREAQNKAKAEAVLKGAEVQEALMTINTAAQEAKALMDKLSPAMTEDFETFRRETYHKVADAQKTLSDVMEKHPKLRSVLHQTVEVINGITGALAYGAAYAAGCAASRSQAGGVAAVGLMEASGRAAGAAMEEGFEAAAQDAERVARTPEEGAKLRAGLEQAQKNLGIALSLLGVKKMASKPVAKGNHQGHKENKGPYDPRRMEEHLKTQNPGAAVDSSTLPKTNHPNVGKAGERHTKTGIVFDRSGFPIFDDIAKFDTKIAREFSNIKNGDLHMKQATIALRDQINSGKINSSRFNLEQLTEIQKGNKKIPGYTWHHHQEVGRMQLVPEKIHKKTGHVGGIGMWPFEKKEIKKQ